MLQQGGHESRRSLAQLKSDTHGICHQLVLTARETVTKKTRATDQQQQILMGQATSLHERIKSIPGGPSLFLETIQSLRSRLLQDFDTQNPPSSESSKSAEILKIFRAHHAERLEQIEVVLGQMAEREQQKDDLIERIQQSMKTLDQSGSHSAITTAGVHLELEVAKAQVAGLSASLEFVQAEQELLIERALSTEDSSTRLEAIGRGSRAAQQKRVQAQRTLQQLAQLLILEHETLRHRVVQSREDMAETAPLLTKLTQRTRERMNSVEQGCTASVVRLKQQQELLRRSRQVLTPPSSLIRQEFSDPHVSIPSRSLSSHSMAPYVSQDRQALDRVALHSELRLQASLVEQMEAMQCMMDRTTEQLSTRWSQGIETCKSDLEQAYPEFSPEMDPVGVAMNTKDVHHTTRTGDLEAEGFAAIETLEKYDHIQEHAALQQIQRSLELSETALATTEQIESLVQEAQMLQDSPWINTGGDSALREEAL
ncbi:hypothetical protein DFQ26_002214 [Actinomortierella ambigua]|nr:hypothetical protein DFQ26_002214 [Actinomortierella ambigua]